MAHILKAGEHLEIGDKLISPDGRFELVLQSDGNLVAYKEPEHNHYWKSSTDNTDVRTAELQVDGNLVLYSASRIDRWASGAHPIATYYLTLQNDGNLVIYKTIDESTQEDVWSSGIWTAPAEPPETHLYCCIVRDGEAPPVFWEDIEAESHAAAVVKCNDERVRRQATNFTCSSTPCGDTDEG